MYHSVCFMYSIAHYLYVAQLVGEEEVTHMDGTPDRPIVIPSRPDYIDSVSIYIESYFLVD